MALLSADTYQHTHKTDLSYEGFITGLSDYYQASDKRCQIKHDTSLPELTFEFIAKRKFEASWGSQFCTLYKRASVNAWRSFLDNIVRLCSVVVFALLLLALYFNVRP